MLVSIVVLNYNYARFLDQAIDSALRQTHAPCEVVVVDNGSTDNSLDVIRSYGQRVRLARQRVNIGQGQGYNLGLASSRGEWLIWLDADDMLDDDAIAECLAQAKADTAKVQFPLRLVDADAQPLGGTVPFVSHHGDVRDIIRKFGHYAGPPGSGNLYRRSAVAPYFPVPVKDWPICTDTVPFITAAFHGQVVDTGRALGSYRMHGKASQQMPGYSGNYSVNMAAEVRLNAGSRDRSLALLRTCSGIEVNGPFLTLPAHVRNRIISWRLDPAKHPFADDTARSLQRLMRDSLRECPGYSTCDQWLMRIWAAGVLRLPRPWALRVMDTKRTQPRWNRLMRWTRKLDT